MLTFLNLYLQISNLLMGNIKQISDANINVKNQNPGVCMQCIQRGKTVSFVG